jgi:hypothetical protein
LRLFVAALKRADVHLDAPGRRARLVGSIIAAAFR